VKSTPNHWGPGNSLEVKTRNQILNSKNTFRNKILANLGCWGGKLGLRRRRTMESRGRGIVGTKSPGVRGSASKGA